jgi:urate oxidase
VIELGENRYGKSAIRLVKVVREGAAHRVRDLTVTITLEGDFGAAHIAGDNSRVIATDTMKNTVYALAADHLTGSIEDFGLDLAAAFDQPQVTRAQVDIDEHQWLPIVDHSRGAQDAFVRTVAGIRTTRVVGGAQAGFVEAGVRDLTVMKTAKSAFSGFPRDRYTTLAETEDRILATKIDAMWRYGEVVRDYDASFAAVRRSLLSSFAEHESPSVQASIWIIGSAVLEGNRDVTEIRMRLPNLHHWRVDLKPFGIDGEHDVYVATTEPHGLIEATVRRRAQG